ncbi:molybdate ABC transporter substrate-binding protein [Saccharomonospora saliphila]|uniref:molybdate ABC transporter substrate-binding protein n=1 Tax=Saccharomonospora saliphila TaxID=369829 RepID=UPI00037D85BA|nr:molybdate ABC transporter substrate-binding protein [Saccharomonospora saliphila]
MAGPLALALVLVAALVTACGTGTGREKTVTVFAAASLTDVFAVLERRFEDAHPEVDVRLNTAGSATLARQVAEGAPADLIASADQRTLRELTDEGLLAGPPEVFATNTLALAVAPGNPRGITGFADLTRPGLTVVVCAPTVPCGAATERLERVTGLTPRPASEEGDVRAVLTKVEVGSADAGVVYETDVASSEEVDRVPLPEARARPNRYPVAVTADAAEPEAARAFRDLLLGPEGERVLTEAGFGRP